MSHMQDVISRLESLGLPFELYHHAPCLTMEDCMNLPFSSPQLTYCKNLLLTNRQQTAFWYLLLPALKPFRTAVVSKALGTSRLSFATAEQLRALMDVESGSLSPFSLWLDRESRVCFTVDPQVRGTEKIAFHPCDNTATLVFDQGVFWERVVPELKHPVHWLPAEA